ncbi:MAG: hypothetical protein F6J90_28315 [Moorea sp. SIOASIH]|uniref:hypothetical protein n=1 Tax=Moorena sp. SIOASIH TaxID=2607817 RepID=UPI0013B6F59A|nr:hypothetical protein [Moorena sp. SIOASIH]NEO40028.1 hypothetical protein [Moorena sp. SIOASIH]NEO90314.1 hypothetical protein [Moorena sp. SIO3G5]
MRYYLSDIEYFALLAYFRLNSTGSAESCCPKGNPLGQKSRFVIIQGNVAFVKGIESKLTEAIARVAEIISTLCQWEDIAEVRSQKSEVRSQTLALT